MIAYYSIFWTLIFLWMYSYSKNSNSSRNNFEYATWGIPLASSIWIISWTKCFPNKQTKKKSRIISTVLEAFKSRKNEAFLSKSHRQSQRYYWFSYGISDIKSRNKTRQRRNIFHLGMYKIFSCWSCSFDKKCVENPIF